MNARRHLLVRASAGTGKTYELSSRYLALLLAGVDADRILATTFTRKAAHEILDRIVGRLAASAGDGKSGEQARALLSASIGREVAAEECLEALERLLRGVDRVRIGTIDAFFSQLGRLFALDLGLPPAWRVGDEAEADQLRSEAVAEAIAAADPVEILGLLRAVQGDAAGSRTHDLLLGYATGGRQALLESAPEAWRRIEAHPDAADAAVEAAARALPAWRVPRTKAGGERKRWADTKRKLLDQVERGAWIDVLDHTLVRAILTSELEYDSVPIEPEHVALLRPIVDRALSVLTRQLVLQNAAARELLERYEAAYLRLSRERGLLRFEDLPEALAPCSGEDPLAARGVDLGHRLDGRVDHLLLDEFQDTAPVQWRVLRALADSILGGAAGERTFFCVGDEKQSIYGWRSGEPRLLAGLRDGRPALQEDSLTKSFRSSRAVLDVVNRVFGSLETNRGLGDASGVVAEFRRTFAEHAPNVERPGAAFAVRARVPAEGEDVAEPVLAETVERVRSALAEAPRATVGVLVRRRATIPDLVRRLREKGIAASDEGGNPLTDSVEVLRALSLLHLADHPGDTAAAFHVAASPLGARFGLGSPPYDAAARARIAEVARGIRATLAEVGLGAFLASIRPAGTGRAWDLARYDQLVDLAFAWEPRAGSRASAFVEHVRRTKVEDRDGAPVRVMTVHASKGLQFDAVVLPLLEGRSGKRPSTLIWSRPRAEGAIEIVTHRLRKEISAGLERLEAVRLESVRREELEELCVLYVATTRAVHRLDLIVPGREKERESASGHAAVVRAALGLAEVGPAGEAWRSDRSTTPAFPPKLAATAEAPTEEPEAPPIRLAPSRRPRSLPTRSPSREKDLERVDVGRLLQPRDAATARGRIAHRLLEEIEWLETFTASDEHLLAIARPLDAAGTLAAAAVSELRSWLGAPGLRELLRRPEEDVEVWRERPFALLLPDERGNEVLWTGAFDRVVLRRRGGEPTSAEIVDFKTDREPRADAYRPQMEAYRRVLAAMTGLPETAIHARLAFVRADAVVDV